MVIKERNCIMGKKEEEKKRRIEGEGGGGEKGEGEKDGIKKQKNIFSLDSNVRNKFFIVTMISLLISTFF
jgi:hypothetical protein